ncbi:GNAT family N-acetyltransferase [Winogradskya consettensis]|uniref:N-acetyltransferase n=1 Tax=Winogradskya consettensis TaxID=113560 RepID=A0A919SHC3_9ACTN|nr:GNAT family N-acetyltransferase [Actinoplanes consettensis]GIM71885.1 N-acetyltransferase [Actinoplanes consettensis]
MEIREATPQDWPAIYPFWSQIVEARESYVYPLGASSDEARAIWMQAPPAHVVVAVDGDGVLGSATMGPNKAGPGSHVATGSFMVGPEAQGRGVGRALGEYLIDWSRRSGFRGIQFNAVVETNAPAVHLWKSLGFAVIGTVPEAFDSASHGLVGLHVMYQKL